MFRRDFIQRLTAASATGTASLAAAGKASAAETRTTTFRVKGFTCITCAVGLEVVLREQEGIARARAFYREGKVVVGFDPSVTSVETIQGFINTTTGFTVTEEKS